LPSNGAAAITPERQLELTRLIRDSFHQLYYNHCVTGGPWLGVTCWKCPLDLWIYQEIICELEPDLIIETGSAFGGSALYLATICDLVDHGRIVSIDIKNDANVPAGYVMPMHDRIAWLRGDSVSLEVIREVAEERAAVETAMVILDSNHKRGHVLRELKAYAPMVSVGQYLIVEDTNIGGHPVLPDFGPGPWEAVGKFLEQQDDFRIDVGREKFLLSFNPGGYLRRVK
jgi:cephalosporin hydroxylase